MPLSVFLIIFIDFILCRFLEIFTNSKTYTIDAFPRYCWTYMTLRGCFLRQAQQFRKTNPLRTHFVSIARLQSYLLSGSKTYKYGFLKIFPEVFTNIDAGLFLCRENRHGSSVFISLLIVIFKHTWTESDIIAPITLRIGLRVRITADRKDRYTLLLGFPVSRTLKLKKWLFPLNGSFRLENKHRFAQLLSQKISRSSRRQQKLDPHELLFPKGTTSLHIE